MNKSGQSSRYLPKLGEMNIKMSVPHTTNINKAIPFKFDIGRCVAKKPSNDKQPTKVSKASKHYKSLGPLPVMRKLDECDRVITIDIETHRLIHDSEMIKNRWVELDFGLPGRVVESCIHEFHIVQIGWTVGGIDQDEPRVVQRLIKPEGFHISADATQKHNISHEAAMNNGEPLHKVLKELLADVRACCVTSKGRLAAHHLAFDAGIVAHELIRCGLGELYEEWASFARQGICTMDPDLVCIVRKWMGLKGEHGDPIPWSQSISLKDIVLLVTPEYQYLLQEQHHANADAEMCWRVWKTLALQRAALWKVVQSP